MTTFWVLAALLALAAAAFLVYPLWQARRASGRWSAAGLAAAIATVPAAVLLYHQVTTYSDAEPELPAGVSQEQADLVAQLAERMERTPDDVEGWRLLGRSYMALGQYVRARRAFQEAWNRTEVPDNRLKMSMAESMIFTDRSSLGSDAAELIDDVLRAEPRNQKALYYGGLVAMQQGREDVAVSRWTALLETNPPPDLASRLQTQIAAMTGGAAPRSQAPRPAGQGGETADGPTIEIDVRVGDDVALDSLGEEAALFIFASAAGGGPPIAAIRESVEALPGTFTLSDANTMIQGRSLADYEELVLVARISASGEPTEQAGDYFARTTYRPDGSGEVELLIDQVVP